jgi:hypothetical protein
MIEIGNEYTLFGTNEIFKVIDCGKQDYVKIEIIVPDKLSIKVSMTEIDLTESIIEGTLVARVLE